MPDFTDDEFMILFKLWAEAYLRIKKIGEMLLKKQSLKKDLQSKMGIGEMEFEAVKKNAKGEILSIQRFKSTGNGKIKDKYNWKKE